MRVDTTFLREAGQRLMRQHGKPLELMGIRAQIYKTPGGDTVRLKTNRKRALIVRADNPTAHARLRLEKPLTEWLLIVIPARANTNGVDAFLVPTPVVIEAVRRSHAAWLASCPMTGGKNVNRTIWFDEALSSKALESGDFATKWSCYKLCDDS